MNTQISLDLATYTNLIKELARLDMIRSYMKGTGYKDVEVIKTILEGENNA